MLSERDYLKDDSKSNKESSLGESVKLSFQVRKMYVGYSIGLVVAWKRKTILPHLVLLLAFFKIKVGWL